MPMTANYTACSVNNLDEMGLHGRRFLCRVKHITVAVFEHILQSQTLALIDLSHTIFAVNVTTTFEHTL